MPLSRYGLREILFMTVVLGAIGAALWQVHWSLAIPAAVLLAAGLAFFRDPWREIPSEPGLLVAPADGVVTEVTDLEYDHRIGGPASKIGIFLSVLDVHVNRSPCGGRVAKVDYQPGEFLDARHPESGHRNESNTMVIEPEADVPGPLVVRQVSGLIARRIVCGVSAGDAVRRGQRIGMIKFGSRTELIAPRSPGHAVVVVAVGDRVWGGRTVLMQYPKQPTPGPRADEGHDETDRSGRLAQTAAG